ncbi:MAG: hypothetical protein KBB40_03820 [Clostridia bacterium]|jgi:spore maturation protein SpmB|nr:hypothetical protein [Clostridia bacterium]
MNWAGVFLETFEVSFSTIFKMTVIIVPLLIGIEYLKEIGWMEKLSAKLRKVSKLIELPGEAALGMIVAYSVGLVFGSGVIIRIKKEVEMTRKQINTMFIFIGMCHAVVEETIIFTAVGANGIIVLVSRVLASFLFGLLYVWIAKNDETSVRKSSEKEIV